MYMLAYMLNISVRELDARARHSGEWADRCGDVVVYLYERL